MIHEIAPHTFDNAFRPRHAGRKDVTFFFHRGDVFLPPSAAPDFRADSHARATFPTLEDYPEEALALLADRGSKQAGAGADARRAVSGTQAAEPDTAYLFSLDRTPFFLLYADTDRTAGEAARTLTQTFGWKKHGQNFFRTFSPGHLAFAGITARHIALWMERRRFCGRCGAKTVPSHTERAVVCPECALTAYPDIMPAVIVAVTDGDRLLMVRNNRTSSTYTHFALVAGYTEIGETFEQTAAREVMEETGLKIKNLKYFGNQPWAFSNSQMIAFFAELDGPPEITLQTSELTEAAWFHRADIPLPPYTASIGNEMIRRFKENRAVVFPPAPADPLKALSSP